MWGKKSKLWSFLRKFVLAKEKSTTDIHLWIVDCYGYEYGSTINENIKIAVLFFDKCQICQHYLWGIATL